MNWPNPPIPPLSNIYIPQNKYNKLLFLSITYAEINMENSRATNKIFLQEIIAYWLLLIICPITLRKFTTEPTTT